MSRRKKKKPFFLRRNIISLFVVILIVAGILLYIRDVDHKEVIENQENSNELVDGIYHSLENTDSTNYIANIIIEENTDILKLSNKFYGDEIFWPYIFLANSDIDNILNIDIGTIIKIPKVSSHLINKTYKESVIKAQMLGDSLLNDVQIKRKKKLEAKSFEDW